MEGNFLRTFTPYTLFLNKKEYRVFQTAKKYCAYPSLRTISPAPNNPCSIEVPSSKVGKVIGKDRSTIKYIENVSKTRIQIPKKSDLTPIFFVSGDDEGISTAKELILSIVKDEKKRKYTHFLAVPLDSTEVIKHLTAIQSQITSIASVNDIEPEMYVPTVKFHVTLGMLSLPNSIEVKRAERILLEWFQKNKTALQNLTFSLGKLEVMEKRLAEAHVLYIDIKDPAELSSLCASLLADFKKEGLYFPELREQKFHATLVNSKYRKSSKRSPFDASNILNLAVPDLMVSAMKIHLYSLGGESCDGGYKSECHVDSGACL